MQILKAGESKVMLNKAIETKLDVENQLGLLICDLIEN